MTNLLDRVRYGVQVGLSAVRNADNIRQVERNLDQFMAQNSDPIEQKAVVKRQSKLNIHSTTTDSLYGGISNLFRQYVKISGNEKMPAPYTDEFDLYTSTLWQQESILAGAVYSMGAKMTALKWQITGPKAPATEFAKMLSRAAYNGGYDWGGFASSSAQDFYTLNRGVFWETARDNRFTGPMEDIGYIDGLSCWLTGNSKYPVNYHSTITGQQIRFRPGEYVHFASMPSGREENLGSGFCAVARAVRAAKLLIGLANYDSEKLANLPPEGVASVTGLTIDEFQEALALWMASRKKDNSLTFPQVLWLIGSNPNAKVEVGFTGFSQIPESFDRETVVEQYVNTLALVFGVDAREFWPISTSSLGTAAESEIQHMKAKGKGPGEFISLMERHINGELPEGVDFSFDTQDIEEDAAAAATANAWISAFLPLVMSQVPQPGQQMPLPGQVPQLPQGKPQPNGQPAAEQKQLPGGGEGIISKDDFIRLLVDRGVLPDWLSKDKRTAVHDFDIHEKDIWGHDGSEAIVIKWDRGVLTATRTPAVTIISDNLIEVPYADVSKGEYFVEKGGPGSGHHGHSGIPGKQGGSLPGTGGSGGANSKIVSGLLDKHDGVFSDNSNDAYKAAHALVWDLKEQSKELGLYAEVTHWTGAIDPDEYNDFMNVKNYMPKPSHVPESMDNNVFTNAQLTGYYDQDGRKGSPHIVEFYKRALAGDFGDGHKAATTLIQDISQEVFRRKYGDSATLYRGGSAVGMSVTESKSVAARAGRLLSKNSTVHELTVPVDAILFGERIVPSPYPEKEWVIDTSLLNKEYKGQSDAPNYKKATDINKKCTTCEYANGQYCELYDFTFKTGWVCDSWESAETKEAWLYLKQREDEILESSRNIRGKPIPAKEAVRGDNVTHQTIKDELERWRNHPILSKYVPEEESAVLGRLDGSAKAPAESVTSRNGAGGSVAP